MDNSKFSKEDTDKYWKFQKHGMNNMIWLMLKNERTLKRNSKASIHFQWFTFFFQTENNINIKNATVFIGQEILHAILNKY